MTVRTRIAPSPTGAPHIGTAYIALFNYAFAKKNKGQFILRIEDTDQQRSTPESEQAIFDALRWVGMAWDEGPDSGGPMGPYRQSERMETYRQYGRELVDKGAAYPCFCTAERLNELRQKQMEDKATVGYDGHCAGLPSDEVARRIAAGEPHVIRMKVPSSGECIFKDRLRDEIRIPWAQVDHQVLLKSDGFPTYHLANVVDDHLMQITHVIRGEEWISSTPKHVLLYQLFGWQPPEFIHLPLLRNPDKSKLSKRKNPTSILYYQRAGFLPAAIRNYLGLMAYSLPDGREFFSLEDLVETFDIDRVSLGGPVFDVQKLQHFNAEYIRAMPPADLLKELKAWALNDEVWLKVLPLAQPRLEQLSDVMDKTSFLFTDRLRYEAAALIPGEMDGLEVAKLIKAAQWLLEVPGAWDTDTVRQVFERIAETKALKLKKLLPIFFVAMAGSTVALPLFDSMVLLGRDMVLRRLQYALDMLDETGVSLKGKTLKKFEKEFQSDYAGS
ncbi:MAG: glutamate--tRNA ligase [Spartobacteria bacterium]|nr:glutamate--tRNA ligase [Spartobacteria bacterium]